MKSKFKSKLTKKKKKKKEEKTQFDDSGKKYQTKADFGLISVHMIFFLISFNFKLP